MYMSPSTLSFTTLAARGIAARACYRRNISTTKITSITTGALSLAAPSINSARKAQILNAPHNHFRSFSETARIANMSSYKVKDLTSLASLGKGEKKEVELEGIEDGKVLLCNVGGKVSAVGSKCTHYGAPLVKGVLTSDGRITCPWHGGEFATSGLAFIVLISPYSLFQCHNRRY